jgi:hypothetical protein
VGPRRDPRASHKGTAYETESIPLTEPSRFVRAPQIATNDLENQELTMPALHLLQICLVYINTLMIQRVLTEPDWTQRMLPEDLRALTPLIYSHQEPAGYSLRPFRCLLSKRLASINVRIASSRLCTSSRKASTVGDDGMPRRQVNRNSTGAEAGWNG